MNKIKQKFAEFRQSTPIHVQWLLLAAAFLVVFILLLLLLSGRGSPAAGNRDAQVAILSINPSRVEWRNTPTGDAREQRIVVSSTVDTIITDVRISGIDDPSAIGLSRLSTCENMGRISHNVSCRITLNWRPTIPLDNTDLEIRITYHAASQSAEMANMEVIPVLLSTHGGRLVANDREGTEDLQDFDNFTGDAFLDNIFGGTDDFNNDDDWNFIPPSLNDDWDFDPLSFPLPAPLEPLPFPLPAPEPIFTGFAPAPVFNDCLEFAFPGYNLSGAQNGWIRPSAGRYLFHPFGDSECTNPIGVYNINTGMISDIANPGTIIGTDADRIGHRSFFANNTGLPGLAPSPRTARAQNRAAPAMGMPAAPLARGGRLRDENGNPVNFGARTTRTFRPTSVHADEQGSGRHATISSLPIDRTFVLRQYKPIPATIVNEVRADARTMGPGPGNMGRLPVMATVDRNVFADNGRTIILPAGTQMMGYVTGELPGPYRTIGRMQINWYRFIRPDNVEFNFQQSDNRPFAADAQGRTGVPGRGSTDYIESMIMPMMTALVPAAVNLIAPISDRFVNQIDLDNNTVTQTGTVRSSELAKQEIISSWNQVVQRLVLDMMDNTTPPFSIAAGTRITVFSPTDLVVTCADADADPNADPRSCAMVAPNMEYADFRPSEVQLVANFDNVSDWMGQVRSLNVRMDGLCETDFNGNFTGRPVTDAHRLAAERGIDFRAVVFHCQSGQFQAMNNVRWNQFFNQQHQLGQGNQVGMTQMPGLQPQQPIFSPEFQQNQLGMQVHPETGLLLNPFAPLPPPPPGPAVLLCEDGTHPDSNGCCTGEILTDMGDLGMNCCPVTGGDCFPPLQ